MAEDFADRMIILGLGNPIRGDDGVGWRVVEVLQSKLAKGKTANRSPGSGKEEDPHPAFPPGEKGDPQPEVPPEKREKGDPKPEVPPGRREKDDPKPEVPPGERKKEDPQTGEPTGKRKNEDPHPALPPGGRERQDTDPALSQGKRESADPHPALPPGGREREDADAALLQGKRESADPHPTLPQGGREREETNPSFSQGGRENIEVDMLAGGGLNLMERLVGYDRAIVVDAMQSGREPGSVQVFPLEALDNPSAGHLGSTHETNLLTALEIGRSLGAHLPPVGGVMIVSIEAQPVFEFSEQLSPPVAQAVPEAVKKVMNLLKVC